MRTRNESVFRIKDLSQSTGIHQSDLIQTLVESRIIHFPKESTSCFLNPNPVYYAPLSTIRRRVVKPELLVWRPEVPIAPGTKFTTYSAS
uniref:DNA-binding protein n=1 Tax=Steinernema glaseri TaxID=37863 RepID=A0A1I7YSB3_9BILA